MYKKPFYLKLGHFLYWRFRSFPKYVFSVLRWTWNVVLFLRSFLILKSQYFIRKINIVLVLKFRSYSIYIKNIFFKLRDKIFILQNNYFNNSTKFINFYSVESTNKFGFQKKRESNNSFDANYILQYNDFIQILKIKFFNRGKKEQTSNWLALENITVTEPEIHINLQANLVFHVYYIEIAIEMINFLKESRVTFENIIITYTDESFLPMLESSLNSLKNKNIRFIVVENSYRDTRPFLIALKEISDGLPILKIHTKKSPHLLGTEGSIWRNSLLQELLPNSIQAELFTTWLKQGTVPMVICPKRWLSQDKHWGHNDLFVYMISKTLGFQMVRKLPFPMGTMFWANEALINELKKIPIPNIQSKREMMYTDSTWAHGFERVIGQIIANRGIGLITHFKNESENSTAIN